MKSKSPDRAKRSGRETAWTLCVVSSEAQSETLRDYRVMADADARANGWTITRTFEGVASGAAGPRRLVLELIAALAAAPPEARPDWVWMRRVDRVGRGRIADSTLAMHEIADLGARIWDHDAGEVRLETAADQIVASVRSGLAAMENEVRRGKAAAVYAKRRAAGDVIGNKAPYGTRLEIANGVRRLVPLEPQAEAVREAFRMGAAGAGCVQIARRLAEVAAPHRYQNGAEHVVRWSDSRVSRMLRARAYVTAGVVDEVTFRRAERARAALTRESAGRRWSWPLSGALRCWCGRSMHGIASGPDDRRIRYYYCRARWNHDGRLRMVRADALERRFVHLLDRLAASPALVAEAQRRSVAASPAMLERSLRTARARLADLDRKRATVWDLHLAGKVRADDVQERLDAYGSERAEVVERIATLTAQQALAHDARRSTRDVSDTIAAAARTFAAAPEREQRGIARALAAYFGGLCAERDGELVARRVEDRAPQRRRRTGEV